MMIVLVANDMQLYHPIHKLAYNLYNLLEREDDLWYGI